MKYILYSPSHDTVVHEFTKTNGEVMPERTFHVDERVLCKSKLFPNRRYRKSVGWTDSDLVILECDTVEEAIDEKRALMDYCGECFEIREYKDGKIGVEVKVVVPI